MLALAACGPSGGDDPVLAVHGGATNNTDTTRPVLSFSPGQIDIESGQSIAVTLNASDNVGITTGPSVTCTNGGSFADGQFTAPQVTATTDITCTATASDAAGNSGTASLTVSVTPPASQAMFSVNGSAFKGLVLGAPVTIVDANNPNTILAEGVTSPTDGLFELAVTYGSAFTGTHLQVTVSGGADAQMICDAAIGCGGVAYGQPISIDENFSLSAIVEAPALNAIRTVNLNMITDLKTSLANGAVDTASLDGAEQQVLQVFGFQGNNLGQIQPMDFAQANPAGTADNARLTFISGGLLQSLFESGTNAGIAYENFRDLFQTNRGELVVTESADDPAIVSLHEIYENAAALRSVISSTTQNTMDALTQLDADVATIVTDVVPDTLTNSGSWSLRDVTSPTLTFTPANVTVLSGETVSVAASIVDLDANTVLSSPVCTGGTYDIETQTYSAPANLYEGQSFSCTVNAVDTSGNVGTGSFNVDVTPLADTEAPAVVFNPNSISVNSGQSLAVALTASDNVGLSGAVTVTCTNGGTFTNNEFIAPIVTATTSSICTATAIDAAGNTGTAELTAEIVFIPDTELPQLSFSPANLTLGSAESAASVLTVSDNIGLSGDLTVSCTNGGSFANDVFVAPTVTADTTSVCTASTTDLSGNVGVAELTAQITYAPDTEPPVITAEHNSEVAIVGETSVSFQFSVTDNVAVANTVVECDQLLRYEDGRVYAEYTAVPVSSRCVIRAEDTSGNVERHAVSFRISVPADEGPRITFNPAALSLGANGSGFSDLQAVDRDGTVADGPHVTCTDGVTFIDGTTTAPDTSVDLEAVCTATATDDQGLVGTADLKVSVLAQAPDPVFKGMITFGTPGIDPASGGIDMDIIISRPARGLTIELINDLDEVVSTSRTDENGFYEASFQTYEQLRLRAVAEIIQDGAPDMPVQFVEEFTADARTSTGDPRLPSGLITDHDMDLQLNATFGVMDVIYEGMQKFTEVDPTLIFPKLDVKYTVPSNSSTTRNENSHFTSEDVNGEQRRTMHIAGDVTRDNTDYWDRHVIAHQWVHFIEDSYGRFDSTGQYVGGDQTDIANPFNAKVAFSEGFANAVAGIILDDPIYRDSFIRTEGTQRIHTANVMDLENDVSGIEGWFNVRSIQNIIYDLYDDNNEAYSSFIEDDQSLGLSGIFDALRHPAHMDTSFFSTMFSYREAVNQVHGFTFSGIYLNEDIDGQDAEATHENNDGGDPDNLPIYNVWEDQQMELCSNLAELEYSGENLGITKDVAFTVTRAGVQSFNLISAVPFQDSDPEMIIYQNGVELDRTSRSDQYGDVLSKQLDVGDYILTIFDNDNYLATTGNGSVCLSLDISLLQ